MRILAAAAILTLAASSALGGADGAPADLAAYRLKAGPIRIKGVRDNASGVAYNPRTKTLLVVINSPERIIETDTAGRVKRTIELEGFDDTEGICYVGPTGGGRGDLVAVVEEARRELCIFTVLKGTRTVSRANAIRILLDEKTGGNSGIEGVAYDPKTKTFFAAKEKRPRKLYRCTWPGGAKGTGSPAPRVTSRDEKALGLKDLSGLHWDARSRRRLVLSDESASLVVLGADGRASERLSLAAGSAGLARAVPQAEGVATDGAGRLFIVSEPNLLYVFEKSPDGASRPED